MPALSNADVDTRLGELRGWERDGDEIQKEFEFKDFDASMTFVNRVAELARAADHHPDIDIRYNRVKLTLSTHSEGGVTEKDFALAAKVESASRP